MKFKEMLSVSLRLLVVGLILFAVIYPLLVGGIGQIWSDKAGGSLIEYQEDIAGSQLVGQEFTEPYFFHSRPSSINYQASSSGSANLGPDNPELTERVEARLEEISSGEINVTEVPADLVTESGSALDPHISAEAAYLQIPRVARAANMREEELEQMVEEMVEPRFLGLYGGEKVNVLKLNLRLESEVLN